MTTCCIGGIILTITIIMKYPDLLHYWQNFGQHRLMAFDQGELWESANERINWHEKLEGEEDIQNRVHE